MAYGNTVKDGSGTAYWLLQDADGHLLVRDNSHEMTLIVDSTAGDNDKTATVPVDTQWELVSVLVTLTTATTAGNRQMTLRISDGTDVFIDMRAGCVQAINTTYSYLFAPNVADLTAARGGTNPLSVTTPIPAGLILDAGWTIRMYDIANIRAADDLSYVICVKARPA